jgi:hypothetical protein
MRLKPAKSTADAQSSEAPQPNQMRLKPAKPPADAQPSEAPQPNQMRLKPAKPPADAQPTEAPKTEQTQPAPPEKVSLKPPELPSHKAPAIKNDTADKLDETIQPLPTTTRRSNPLISIIIIAVLFLILSAAAAGIWYLLKSDQQSSSEEQPTASASVSTPVANGPISKAKKTIKKVPVADFAKIEGAAITNSTSVPEPQVVPVPQATTVPEFELKKIPEPAAVKLNEQLKQAASQYLQNVHIGALRTGPRARVMLNGVNYAVNDVVDSNTGLRFLGTRDQRLVFKDKNGTLYVKSF